MMKVEMARREKLSERFNKWDGQQSMDYYTGGGKLKIAFLTSFQVTLMLLPSNALQTLAYVQKEASTRIFPAALYIPVTN